MIDRAQGMVKLVNLEDLERVKLCDASELDLSVCIGRGGQSFSWVTIKDTCCWANIIQNTLIILESRGDSVYYLKSYESINYEQILKNYFNFNFNLGELIEKWSMKDPSFDQSSVRKGVRIIRQDPFETFISFLCSQNNGIPRIINMVQSLAKEFGQVEYTLLEGEKKFEIFRFPKPERLTNSSDKLNQLGFGYRSIYISRSCEMLVNRRDDFFQKIQPKPYEVVVEELQKFPGVGPKVADCIALFGLGKLESVPIDRHILRVAVKYGFAKKELISLTPKTYRQIGDKFRDLFGPLAGWAHSLLFTKQLKPFQAK
jgi:N-glycosylase/DNA lyase